MQIPLEIGMADLVAKKLKTYRTSIGFFDLAVAAPSMKAAAKAWGSDPDIFKRGFAQQTDDPKVVEATLAAPGVVLRRPVGSDGEFSKQAALPGAGGKEAVIRRSFGTRRLQEETRHEIQREGEAGRGSGA